MKTKKIYSTIFIFIFFAGVSVAQQRGVNGTPASHPAMQSSKHFTQSAPASANTNPTESRSHDNLAPQTTAVSTLMNYQSVARNSSGAILANQLIGLRLSIEDGPGGTVLYSERQTPTTNQFGLLTVKLGGGTLLSGSWSGINWSNGNQWLKVDMDPTGGSSYTPMGESELLTVPFANYSTSTAAVNGTTNYVSKFTSGTAIGNSMIQDNGTNIGINGAPSGNANIVVAMSGGSSLMDAIATSGWAGFRANKTTAADNNYMVLMTGGADRWSIGSMGNDDLNIYNWTTASNALNISLSTNNVGIGTATPGFRFEVAQGAVNLSDNQGNTRLFNYGFSPGNALYAESNETGDNSGTIVYSQAQLAGYNYDTPFGGMNAGVWGTVTGSGSNGYGVVATYGLLSSTATTYAGLAGDTYAGYFGGRALATYDPTSYSDNIIQINNSTGTAWQPGISLLNNTESDGVILFGSGFAGLTVGQYATQGYAAVSASAFNVSSDVRVKKDIVHLSASDLNNCLNQIRNIDPITYWYNSEKVWSNGNQGANREFPHIGFTAQSLPVNVITKMSEKPGGNQTTNEIMGYNLSDMIGLNTIGIQALDNKQIQLEKEIVDLKAEIQRLKNNK